MKTRAQEKFDFIVKEGLWLELKPLGFRKKANNFYKNLGETGQVINVQKSVYGSKDAVSFTLNIGVLSQNIGFAVTAIAKSCLSLPLSLSASLESASAS